MVQDWSSTCTQIVLKVFKKAIQDQDRKEELGSPQIFCYSKVKNIRPLLNNLIFSFLDHWHCTQMTLSLSRSYARYDRYFSARSSLGSSYDISD